MVKGLQCAKLTHLHIIKRRDIEGILLEIANVKP